MNASPHSCFIASLIDFKLPRKVRHLLCKEKLKKGAAKGREQAAEDFGLIPGSVKTLNICSVGIYEVN